MPYRAILEAMGSQSCSPRSKISFEETLNKNKTFVGHAPERRKTSVIAKMVGWLVRTEASSKVQSYRLWIIVLLMAFGTLTYYINHTPLDNIPFFQGLGSYPHDLFRTIFLIPIIYAASVFRIRGSIITSLAFLIVVLPRAFLDSPYPDALLRALVFVIITGFVSLLVAIESNRIDKEKENTKLLQFMADCMNKQEGEKQHLARELHDGSLQALVDISHQIDILSEIEERGDIKDQLMQLRDEADSVNAGLRQLIVGLRPPLLEEMGFESSLKWLANDLAEKQGIEVNVDVFGESKRLSDLTELTLYRVAQEALQNAKKHSQATKIKLRLAFIGEKVHLTIQDNGVGFSVPKQEKLASNKKFGLIGMAERARLVGGNFRLESSEGNGTVVFIEVPVIGPERIHSAIE